ncbi:MAG: hypothetical protein HY717_21090 [Planctomycetes bacterium]|nr:hypothetical protein [Planctomycetota bacterium]
MDLCGSCETRLEDGVTKCPACGSDLKRPGTFLELCGWVVIVMSMVPFALGIHIVTQKDYTGLIIGALTLFAGSLMVVYGRIKANSSANPVKAPAALDSAPQKPLQATKK